MPLLIAFAFLAGIVTVLSPCVLPVLPVILSGAAGGGKFRPLGIVSGFALSFTVFTLTLSLIVSALGLPPEILRISAAIAIFGFGLIMLIPALKDRFMLMASRLVPAGSSPSKKREGFGGGFVLGMGLGLVWTPCVGPIMASVIGLALSGGLDGGSIVITLAYALGTSLPLFLIMAGGRALLAKLPFLSRNASRIQRTFGALMVLTSLALLSGADRSFQTWMLKTFPSYGAGLTALEDNAAVRTALEARDARLEPEERGSEIRAEALGGIASIAPGEPNPFALAEGEWINSPPLNLGDLRGKVVLVDFWTYSCINCQRTIPYLRGWYERYRDEGFVIIGVHSPEFAFERSSGNVRKAAAELGVSWPIVQDNAFGIWNAYANRYWPAHYLYDRDGTLRASGFGEGGYGETEAMIRKLLGSRTMPAEILGTLKVGAGYRTPETYLGYGRAKRFSSPETVVADKPLLYSVPENLPLDRWAFSGTWTIEAESSLSAPGAKLALRFRGNKVYLVANPGSGPVEARVSINGFAADGGDVRKGSLRIDEDRLYEIIASSPDSEGLVEIEFLGQARVFAFTFG